MSNSHISFADFLQTSQANVLGVEEDTAGRVVVKCSFVATPENIECFFASGLISSELENESGDMVFPEDLENYPNNQTIYVETTFRVDDEIYTDISHFKRKLLLIGRWPLSFFIVDEKKLFSDSFAHPLLLEIKEKFDFISAVLKGLCKTSQYISETGAAIFVDTQDTSNASVAVATKFPVIFKNNEQLFDEIKLPSSNFIDQIESSENSNNFKEVAVFRNSLLEFFKHYIEAKNPASCAQHLLLYFDKLHEIFLQNYQAFVSQFSLEKIHTELMTEQSKFTEQTSKIIQEITTKLLALPGIAILSRLLSEPNNTSALFSAKIIISAVCIILGIYLSIQIYQIFWIKDSYKIVCDDFSSKLKKIEQGYHFEKLQLSIDKVGHKICFAFCIAFFYLIAVTVVFIIALITL